MATIPVLITQLSFDDVKNVVMEVLGFRARFYVPEF